MTTKKDILQRFIFENAPIRGEIVHLRESFQIIASQHDYPPFIRKLLGEMLAVAALLSANIKFQGRITVQFQGEEKLKLLLAQSDSEFHLRGLAQWQPDLKEEEFLDNLRKGVLVIIVQPESGGKRYQGVVSWQGDSLAQSIEGYFRDSEQLPTRLWLAIENDQVAGLLLQTMPEKDLTHGKAIAKEFLDQINHEWDTITKLTETITPNELLTLDNETMLRRLYSHDNEVRLFPPLQVIFSCTCSTQRSENAILLLGREEIEEELKGKQMIIVTCDFCNKEYVFDRVDIERIFKKGGGASTSSSTRVH